MKKWYIVDAKDAILGRLATLVAQVLRGKHKADFTPHLDCGDCVVIINAEKIKVTGNKEKAKTYFTHSGYPGGDKLVSLEKMRATHPERILEHAIKGMLPHNRLGDKLFNNLRVVVGNINPIKHAEKLDLNLFEHRQAGV